MTKRLPWIGISTDLLQNDGRRLAQLDLRYAEEVLACGGVPVLLPPLGAAEALAGRLDGLILSGGDGLPDSLESPSAPLPADLPPVAPQRLQSELQLYRSMRDHGRPVLGICLGMQLMNLEAGGTLAMDVAQHPGVAGHSRKRGRERHALDLVVGSVLDQWWRESEPLEPPSVNSSHLQAIDQVGQGFLVAARSEDGVIEAIVPTTGLWPMGVQWHPEREPGILGRGLIRKLIEACRMGEDSA